MEYMAGYYRQKEEATALLLQQYVCGGVPLCLGCICGGEDREAGRMGGAFTGQLLQEFRGFSLSRAVRKPEKALERMEGRLCKCWENSAVPDGFWTAGILCIGESFLLFHRGEVIFALCNSRFGRPALHEFAGDRRVQQGQRQLLQIQKGYMETGIGVLLASDSFCGQLSQEELESCLAVRDIRDSGQTCKRVKELGDAAERRGGRNMAALLLEVR